MPEAFVRGIRHIGYKSNVEAIAELVDNSIQAYAEHVDLIFGYANDGSGRKPNHLAVIDDGHGMAPAMMRFAMMWGGTHRENDRSGLGRFGYGLPCATVSMGRRFTVYSKLKRGRVHAITLDLDFLENGRLSCKNTGIAIPAAQPASLPTFLRNAIRRIHPDGWNSGTVVLVEELDRLDWATVTGLRRNLTRHFGVAYHKLLGTTSIHIDGEEVRSVDPLFLEPDGQFYALDDDRAHPLDPVTFRLDSGITPGETGEVTLRYAWLPPTFAANDKSRDAIGINANARFPIIKQCHGIVFSRNGRVIDTQPRTPWTTFVNNDRYIRVEIEFSANLDESFGVTTSKQQVTVAPEMWDHLRVAGLQKAIEHLRFKVRTAKAQRHNRSTEQLVTYSETRLPHGTPTVTNVTLGGNKQREPRLAFGVKLTSTVREILTVTEPANALSVLLGRMERRVAEAGPIIQEEYKCLLRSWAADLSSTLDHLDDCRQRAVNAPRQIPAGAAALKLAMLAKAKQPVGGGHGR